MRPLGPNIPVLYAVRNNGYVELYDTETLDTVIAEFRAQDFQKYFRLCIELSTPVKVRIKKAEIARYR